MQNETPRRRPEHLGSILEPTSPAPFTKERQRLGLESNQPFRARARGHSQMNDFEMNTTKSRSVTTQGGTSHGLPHRHFLRTESQI